jgi:hypothetical protein
MMKQRYLGALTALIALTLAACGGGGGGGSPAFAVAPPAPSPGNIALIASIQNVAVPPTNGASGVVALPPGSGTINVAVSGTSPTGTSTLQSIARSAQSAGTASASGDSALVYVAISTSATATLSGVPGFTLTLPAAPTGSVFEALWNGAQWITVGKAGTVSGTTVTLAGSSATQTVTTNAPLFIVAYEGVSLAGAQSNVIVDGGFETEGAAGSFAGASNGWAACSYAHVDAGSNATAPTPVPAIAVANVTADLVSATTASFTVGATPAPASTAKPAPVIVPATHSGSFAALTYTGTGADTSFRKSATGANGICQTFVVPVGGVLTVFVNEGGDESGNFGDQEATLFAGGLSALAAPAPAPIIAFQELNASVPSTTATPAPYVQRGPYALTLAPPMGLGLTPGTTATLFLGTFDDGPSNKFGEYMFVDDVSLMGFVPQAPTNGGAQLMKERLPGQ